MRTLYDVQQVLKAYGIYIHLGERLFDIELIEIEFKKLHDSKLIDEKTFTGGLLVLKKEHRIELERKEKGLD